jgi:hypothetical protein
MRGDTDRIDRVEGAAVAPEVPQHSDVGAVQHDVVESPTPVISMGSPDREAIGATAGISSIPHERKSSSTVIYAPVLQALEVDDNLAALMLAAWIQWYGA